MNPPLPLSPPALQALRLQRTSLQYRCLSVRWATSPEHLEGRKRRFPVGGEGLGAPPLTPKNSLWKNKCGRSGLASMHAGL